MLKGMVFNWKAGFCQSIKYWANHRELAYYGLSIIFTFCQHLESMCEENSKFDQLLCTVEFFFLLWLFVQIKYMLPKSKSSFQLLKLSYKFCAHCRLPCGKAWFFGKEFCRISVKRELFCHVKIRKEKIETITIHKYFSSKTVHYLLLNPENLNKPSKIDVFYWKKGFHFAQHYTGKPDLHNGFLINLSVSPLSTHVQAGDRQPTKAAAQVAVAIFRKT